MASLVSIIIGALGMIWFFLKKSSVFKFSRFKYSKSVLRHTILNGSSELIGQLSMSISMVAYNWVILKTTGVAGVAAFTVVGYVTYLFNMVVIGFGQGASPLISFAYGAKEEGLSRSIRKITNGFVFSVGLVVMMIMVVASSWYSRVFVQNESVEIMIRSGVTLFVLSFLFSGINTITSFYFTSIGKAKESALISSSRGLVVLLVCIFALPVLFGMTGVWLVAPVTEAITILISLVLIHKHDQVVVV